MEFLKLDNSSKLKFIQCQASWWCARRKNILRSVPELVPIALRNLAFAWVDNCVKLACIKYGRQRTQVKRKQEEGTA